MPVLGQFGLEQNLQKTAFKFANFGVLDGKCLPDFNLHSRQCQSSSSSSFDILSKQQLSLKLVLQLSSQLKKANQCQQPAVDLILESKTTYLVEERISRFSRDTIWDCLIIQQVTWNKGQKSSAFCSFTKNTEY